MHDVHDEAPIGRRRDPRDATPLLQVQKLNIAYGDVQVLWDVSLEIYEGEIVALVGANGAGKSTLLSSLSGLLHPLSGKVIMEGKVMSSCPSHEFVSSGIAHVPEGRRLFGTLSVLENLRMGAFIRRDKTAISRDLEHVLGLFPRLKERLNTAAGKLSGGEQQMVAIGRGMMARPKLLMIDELSLGLAPLIVEDLIQIINTVNKEGTTVLIVEQDVQLALEQAHYGYVLETGQVVLKGDGAELLNDRSIQQVYLGLTGNE